MTHAVHRALAPLALLIPTVVCLLAAVPELRTPLPLSLVATAMVLLVLRPIDEEMRSSSQFKTRVLLIGNRPLSEQLVREIERNARTRYTIVGLVDESVSAIRRPSDHLVLGTIDDLRTIVAAVKPDLIALALSDRRGRMPAAELLEFQANGIIVEDVADAYERVTGKLPIEVVTPGQLIASQRLRKSRALKLAQRLISCCAAAMILVAAAPFLLLIVVAIKIDSGGPVFFRHRRLGKNGRPFDLIKFCTMVPAEKTTSEWVKDNRSRITRLGKWLRRLRLDELPQLVNVVRGDMNLVGPRPHPTSNLQLFSDSIPYYSLRDSILPGITGWAQVRYHYANSLEEETEKMRYDLYYIKHMSLWLDATILFRTLRLFAGSIVSAAREDGTGTVTLPSGIGPQRLRIRREMPSRGSASDTGRAAIRARDAQ